MKKYQYKERSLILISYAFINEGFRLLNIDLNVEPSKFVDELDLKLFLLYKKLFKLNKLFATEKLLHWFNKRLNKIEDEIGEECQPLYIGLLVFYFYLKIDTNKDLFIKEISKKNIEDIIKEHNKYYTISNCTIKKAEDIFKVIYPDEEGYIEFLKQTKRFPYGLE